MLPRQARDKHRENLTKRAAFSDSADADLASIFELLNERAAELHIVDFSVTQTTLEDVFLSFARLQRDDVVEDMMKKPPSCVDSLHEWATR
jgi:hypothetical protein